MSSTEAQDRAASPEPASVRPSDVTLLHAIASALEFSPGELRAKHLAGRARELAERIKRAMEEGE